MASQSLGTLTIDLQAKTANLQNDLGKAQRLTEQTMDKIGKAAATAGAAIGTGIVAGFVAVEEAVRRSLDQMDEFSKAAQKVGVTTEEFSKLAYAAKLSDVSTEDLTTTLAKLSKNQVEAAKGTAAQAQAFSSLGIAVKNADGSLRSPAAVLADLADLFQALPDGAGKTAIAIQLLGKSGANAIPLLNGGAASLKDLGDEAERFGVVIDTQTGKAAEEFNDNITRLQTQVEGFATQLAANLLPDLLVLEQRFQDVSNQADSVKTVGDAVRYVYDTVQLAVIGVQGLVAQFKQLTAAAKLAADSTGPEALKNLATGTFSSTIKQDKADLDAATASAKELKAAGKDVLSTFGQGSGKSAAGIAAAFENSVPKAVTASPVSDGDALKKQQAFLDAQKNAAAASKAQSEADRAARKAQSEAEAQAKRVASATLDMQKAIDDASQSLNKTNIPAVDAYNEALVKITEQAAKYTKDGIPTAQVDAFTDKMKALAKATEDASIAQSELSAHQTTLDLQAQAKDAQSAAAGVTGLAVANRDYEKSLEALDKQFESLQISPDDYQAQLQALDTIHKKTIDDLQKQSDTAGQFALSAAKSIQSSIADALSGEGAKKGFKGFLDGLDDMLRKAAAQIVAADIAKYLFGNYDKTGQVGGVAGSGLSSLSSLLGSSGTASPFEAANIRNSEAAVTGSSGSWLDSAASWFGNLFGGARAGGGPVGQGRGYLVGEHGPEFFMPSTNGSIMTNQALRKGTGRNGLNVTYVVQGAIDRRTQDQLAQAAGREASRAIARNG
jgi:hypothetical protein